MKKINILFVVICMVFSGCFVTNKANAVVETVDDQRCPASGPYTVERSENVFDNNGLGQTFVPTQNRLSFLFLQLMVNAADDDSILTISITDFNGETTLASTTYGITSAMDGDIVPTVIFYDENWDPYDVPLTPGDTYKINLTSSSGSGGVRWVFDPNPNCLPSGAAIIGDVMDLTKDFGFTTRGYNYVAPVVEPPVTPPVDNPVNNTTPNASGTTVTNNATDDSVGSTPAITSTPAPVDLTIKKPAIVSYEKNGQTSYPPFVKEIKLSKGDKLNIVGTSFPGSEVTVFIGQKSYLADTDANGNWSVNIIADGLSAGKQVISAQAQKGENGSEIVDVLNVEVLGAETKKESANYPINYWIFGGIIMIIVLILSVLLQIKYHILNKLFKRK